MSIVLTDENFEREIIGAKKPVLVDFWLQSCTPCFLVSPILEKLSLEFEGKMVFAKINLETAPFTAQKYGITVAPTIILFKEGKPVSGFIGLKPEETIRLWLEENLKNEKEDSLFFASAAASVYGDYAKKNGFFLNPDRKITEGIVKSLLEREKKFGKRYCPCRKITGNQQEDRKIICPCIYHLQELEKDGHCFCRLFVKNI